ncbi:hypothetical protein A3766_09070, partial [Oleiphilus sp. HI0132]|uniref:carbon-nitrogen hydrolase family protein n=1 Tax=Oleiphilus sp. HI0132 TaxID=1822270 RepID=UPI0007C27545
MSSVRRVAAVQMQGRKGDISYNLGHIKELVNDAISNGAEVISLPEFFTTTIVLCDSVKGCSLPESNNAALDLLIDIATSNDVLIGGSYLEKRGEDVYNTYVLVQPDGTVSKHDKDLPTMIENAFYIGGQSDGHHATSFGRVGTAMCWETIRTQTVHRLKDRIDFLMTGSHWWTAASNWNMGSFRDKSDKANREIMYATPGRLAQLLGVPNIHAAHCGEIVGQYPMLAGGKGRLPFVSSLIGETQITDGKGNILKRLAAEEGPGVIVADVDLAEKH